MTTQRPDIALWSTSTRQEAMLELTVPWEELERLEEAHERKKLKYQGLVDECRDNNWKVWCLPVQVGCSGFVGQSLWRTLRMLGITVQERKKIIAAAGKEAEQGSQWIWRKREK